MWSNELDDSDKNSNPACHDDLPVAKSTDATQEKEATDLESGIFNPSVDTVSMRASSAERYHDIVDWDGPNDAENPLNWPRRKRLSHVVLVSVITFIS